MKFGRNLLGIIASSDPEWTPYWINYKYLKKLINEIVNASYSPEGVGSEKNPSALKTSRQVDHVLEDGPAKKKERKNGAEDTSPDECIPQGFLNMISKHPLPAPMPCSHIGKDLQNEISATASNAAEIETDPNYTISKSSHEIDFFRQIKRELKKASNFFASTEMIYFIRFKQISEGYELIRGGRTDAFAIQYDERAWTRLMAACMNFYRDCLLLENFALMNYCAFSKILKKHDKLTGYRTRDAFMRNVMSKQNFTRYPKLVGLLKDTEKLFNAIQASKRCTPITSEESLFISALRELNFEASKLQEEESEDSGGSVCDNDDEAAIPAEDIGKWAKPLRQPADDATNSSSSSSIPATSSAASGSGSISCHSSSDLNPSSTAAAAVAVVADSRITDISGTNSAITAAIPTASSVGVSV